MKWYLSVLRNYAVFSGRARRMEFWMFVLINSIFSLLLSGIDRLMARALEWEASIPILNGIYNLVVFLPSLAVAVRRLHDTGRSGWWILLGLIPCIGPIVLLVFFLQNSQPGTNQYGPNPKEI
ncbi:MAG: DUF805 domain-containing protein [Bacteroidia bacterium]|nr:DUF805 domain-containing protein [Bacteroidia bacterium]